MASKRWNFNENIESRRINLASVGVQGNLDCTSQFASVNPEDIDSSFAASYQEIVFAWMDIESCDLSLTDHIVAEKRLCQLASLNVNQLHRHLIRSGQAQDFEVGGVTAVELRRTVVKQSVSFRVLVDWHLVLTNTSFKLIVLLRTAAYFQHLGWKARVGHGHGVEFQKVHVICISNPAEPVFDVVEANQSRAKRNYCCRFVVCNKDVFYQVLVIFKANSACIRVVLNIKGFLGKNIVAPGKMVSGDEMSTLID